MIKSVKRKVPSVKPKRKAQSFEFRAVVFRSTLYALSFIFTLFALSFSLSPHPVQAVDCTVPISGNMTISSSCSFSGTTNGVDAGTGTTNSAALTVSSGTLTINAGQTVAAGSLIPVGGSIAVISGGAIKPGAPLWAYDADADGYPKETTMSASLTQMAGHRRRNLMTSMITRDCRDFYDSGITCDPATMNMTDGTHSGAYQEGSGTPASSYRELPKDNSTVGLWHMNEVTDNTCSGGQDACDSSGNANHGTFNGNAAFTTTSRLGASATTYDGAGDYVDIGDQNTLDFGAGSFSIEAWVKTTGTAFQFIASKYDTLTSAYWYLALNANGTARLRISDTGALDPLVDGGTAINDGDWHHVAGVRDVASDNLRIYVDGKEDATPATDTTTATTSNAITARIGHNSNSSNYFNGQIDEVRISNIARTPEEIKADAQRRPYASYIGPTNDLTQTPGSWSGLNFTAKGMKTSDGETPASTTNLVAAWNLNETSGTTAVSGGTCGTSCNGTLTNFASTASQDQAAGTGWTANNRRWGAGALMFDGTNDYVSVTDNINNGDNDFTVSGWFNANALSGFLMSKRDGDATNIEWNINIVTNPVFSIFNSAGTSSNVVSSSVSITTGVWHHLTAVNDKTNSQIKLYLDGILVGTTTKTVTITDSASPFRIGARHSTPEAFFKGVIDSTRIYSRSLTASEILANYQSGNIEFQTRTSADNVTWEAWRPVTNETALDSSDSLSPVEKISQTSLTAYWKLDETSGTRADSKGSNTLTDNNTVTYAPGRLGNAADFERDNNEYLSIADNADLSTGNIDFTLAGWFQLESKPVANLYAYTKGTGSALTAVEYSLAYQNAGSQDRFSFFIANHNKEVDANSLGSPSAGAWYFIVAWHDATADTINIQVNNGAVDSTATAGTASSDTTGNFLIGNLENSATYAWDGLIDEVAFWKRTLTAAERTRLFEDGLDLHAAGSGRIYRTRDTATKIEGTASEKLQIGSPQVDASTVGLWHMEETSGTGAYIQDATANNNDGTPTGTTVVDGFFGKARSFNGTSDYVSVSAPQIYTIGTGDFTIEAWVKSSATGSSYHDIVTIGETASESDIVFSFSSYHDSAYYPGSIYFRTRAGNTNSETWTNNTYNDGNWHHVVVKRDTSGTKQYIYVDGGLITETTVTARNVQIDTAPREGVIGGRYVDHSQYFPGTIDEARVSNTARTAEEIAEAYRAGRDHRISKTITSTDLSNSTKLPFYVASDRPGTFLEATVGESAYANYEPDANTVGLWHLEEQTGTANTYIKDSSGNSNNSDSITGTTFVQGKVGKARNFDGTDDVIRVPDATSLKPASAVTVETWFYPTTLDSTYRVISFKPKGALGNVSYGIRVNSSNQFEACINNGGDVCNAITSVTLTTNTWYHGVLAYDGATFKMYLNGVLGFSSSVTGSISYDTEQLRIGSNRTSQFFAGTIDEVRISNTARSADEIRQAYEVGKRTHPVTIDFSAKGDAGNLITGSTDYSFTVDATAFGAQNKGDNVFVGDKVIVRENVGGTEYIAQGDVSAVTASTGAVTVSAWDSGGTFPTGGYTANSHFFKWQREYFDLNGSLSTQRDAITRLTLRVTDGNEGRTVWLDDFRSASYLADNTPDSFDTATGIGTYSVTGASIGSTLNRYIQTRAIFSSWDPASSATLTSSSVEYGL